MYSQILDRETYQQVIGLAPQNIPCDDDLIAREVLEVIGTENVGEPYQTNQGKVWHLSVSSLAKRLPSKPSPNKLGHILGELGLPKERKSDGYHVYWNQAQLDLLTLALFNSGEENHAD